jgi:hypothetical protein
MNSATNRDDFEQPKRPETTSKGFHPVRENCHADDVARIISQIVFFFETNGASRGECRRRMFLENKVL